MAKSKPTSSSSKPARKSTRTSAAKAPQAKSAAATPAAAPAKRTVKTKVAAPSPNPMVQVVLTHDQIASKAYEIWVRKGRPTGLDEQNWKEAEQELLTARA